MMLIVDERVREIRIHLDAGERMRGAREGGGGFSGGRGVVTARGRGGWVMHACVCVAYRRVVWCACATRRALGAAVELPLGGTRAAASPGPDARPM